MDRRDLYGYRDQRPQAQWPGGASVALNFVLNVEEGAELSLADGDASNEPMHEVTSKVTAEPDLCRESHFEYGLRTAYWRVLREFEEAGLPCTLNVCGRVAERTPALLKEAVGRGHDVCAHGWLWQSPAGMNRAQERAMMLKTLDAIEHASGVRPTGWHCKSTPTLNTRALACELGLLYDSDAYNDELPYWAPLGQGQALVLPYQFDTNDMRFFGESPAFVQGRDFSSYVIETLKRLLYEGDKWQSQSMLTVGLHLRIIGRPGRIQALHDILNFVGSDARIWATTRTSIAQHWLSHHPAR
jgi:peptidoglycan/xylan/chitin deacetylase (PgdA/CDA1 family)